MLRTWTWSSCCRFGVCASEWDSLLGIWPKKCISVSRGIDENENKMWSLRAHSILETMEFCTEILNHPNISTRPDWGQYLGPRTSHKLSLSWNCWKQSLEAPVKVMWLWNHNNMRPDVTCYNYWEAIMKYRYSHCWPVRVCFKMSIYSTVASLYRGWGHVIL